MVNAKINEAVPKSADDYLLTPEEAYNLQFSRLVETPDGKKSIRASFDIGHKQFLEIIEKYGLKPAQKWQIWNANSKKNERYTEK